MLEPSSPQPAHQPCSWLHVNPGVRAAAAWFLWALLAGYLIFNKPFAQQGFPPLYVGEMVLVCVLLSLLERLPSVVVEPLRRSWAFRLIAVFWLYGVVRALTGYQYHGWWALRDSVTATYAYVAFALPAAWAVLACPRAQRARDGAKATAELEAGARELPSHVAGVLVPCATLAALWSAAMLYGWVTQNNWPETKADFLTQGAAVAAWVWAMAAVKVQPWQAGTANREGNKAAFLGLVVLAAEGFFLVRALPTRTMWLVVGPLAALIVAAWAYTPGRRRILFAAGVGAILAATLVLGGVLRSFCRFEVDYGLAENLDFSSDTIEANLRKNPDRFERLVLNRVTSGDRRAERERWRSLLAPDESQFETEQGRLGAHAVKWRAVFWLRCWHYALHQAPLLGVGFGTNLTNLLRNTPAWPMYIDSMRVAPPNRSPHCAHVTILARLGLLGLALWVGILATVLWGALESCWYHRTLASSAGVAADQAALHRARFWDGVTVLGVWVIYLWAMTFGVVLEGPIGGVWFWGLTGVLVWWRIATPVGPANR